MLRTRLTERFKLSHPVILAPMGFNGGGRLAAAVAAAGGLGLIGGGYGNEAWLREQLAAAGNERVGCGFITWSLKEQPHLLEIALERAPAAMFLSYGDPEPFVDRIKQARVPFSARSRQLWTLGGRSISALTSLSRREPRPAAMERSAPP